MKKLIIAGTFCAVALLGGGQYAFAQTTETTTTSRAEMMAKIQDLMKLIADLQAKLTEARGEVKDLVEDLKVGAEGDDVKEIQEILASDPTLLGAKPTGYYGPLTEAAIKKFQERYGLPVTGVVDEATREVMKELKMEKKDGKVPPGLVKSDEVKARIKDRLQAKWGDCIWGEKFRASDCKKGKGDDMDDDEDGEDSTDDDDDTEVTRDDARRAVVDAQNELNTFRDSIDDMEDDDATEEEIDEALDTLKEAQKKMVEARRALARRDFEKAYESSQEVLETLDGEDDDSDDESEDEDEDSDEDEEDEDDDEDEDEDDEDDES